MKHKIGDKVQIRSDLMIGQVYGTCFITPNMHNLCGEIVRITEVNKHIGGYRISSCESCLWTDEMFEDKYMEVQEMHKGVTITVSNNKVIAYCDGKLGVARCHPDDTLIFILGRNSHWNDWKKPKNRMRG